jgi:hypothetical protein
MRNKFEQLIEYIINDETEKAHELFHAVVVEKSREIYNELVAEDFDGAEPGAPQSLDQTDDMMGDISADEEGMDHNDSDDMGDEFGHDEEDEVEHDEGDIEDRVVDLEDALDDLKAEFEKLMHDEQNEPEHDMAEEGVVREYTEKVKEFYKGDNGEGTGVGAGSLGGSTNTKSTVAGKNDMGGTAKNIAQNGSNPAPEGSAYKEPTNEYAKGKGKLPGAGSYENVPGAKAGKAFSSAKKPVTSEISGTNKKSTID